MMVFGMLILLLGGGLLCWGVGRIWPTAARWLALVTLALGLLGCISLWGYPPGGDGMVTEVQWQWLPQLGITFHLGLDGLSLVLTALSLFLGIVAVLSSWSSLQRHVGFFHFNLLWALGGVVGVFAALDLIVLYFFWEVMLVPVYFIIGIWGHDNRMHAAIKFFIFTQLSGLLMLAAILGLALAHHAAGGAYTFDYFALLNTPVGAGEQMLMFLGFFAAFAVKMPLVPVHTWLPDAYSDAPTAGTVVLAGPLLDTGVYGLIRFAVPLFPKAAHEFAPLGMTLGVVGIIYGAWVAFGQTNAKRLVAYTSVSHVGFVALAVFAFNEVGLQGAVLETVCHGLSTGALFMVVGLLHDRLDTREFADMGGLWRQMPRMGAVALVLAMATIGLPGTGNFMAEFLSLLGAFQADWALASIAAVGHVLAVVYALWLIQRIFFGEPGRASERADLPDLTGGEVLVFAALIAALIWIGLYPQSVLGVTRHAIRTIVSHAAIAAGGAT